MALGLGEGWMLVRTDGEAVGETKMAEGDAEIFADTVGLVMVETVGLRIATDGVGVDVTPITMVVAAAVGDVVITGERTGEVVITGDVIITGDVEASGVVVTMLTLPPVPLSVGCPRKEPCVELIATEAVAGSA